ncbi:MAG: sigma-70 family RNA polymerase sigma factor [Planctomycetia bacterium]|nr:sigma-70 family RNA polymerase sigma factor [Planctomycetia bacterium]
MDKINTQNTRNDNARPDLCNSNNVDVAMREQTDSELPRSWRGVKKFTRVDDEQLRRHMPLLNRLVSVNAYGSELTYDEKIAAGAFGLAVALERYKPEKGVALVHWLAFQADKAIRDEVRAHRVMRRNERFFDDNTPEPIDQRANEIDILEEKEDKEKQIAVMRQALEKLQPRAKRVINALYFQGKTQSEVAKMEHTSQSWISKVAINALTTLREEMQRLLERDAKQRQFA